MKQKFLKVCAVSSIAASMLVHSGLAFCAQLDEETQAVSIMPNAYSNLSLLRGYDNKKGAQSDFDSRDAVRIEVGSAFYDGALKVSLQTEGFRSMGNGYFEQGAIKAGYKWQLASFEYDYANLEFGSIGKFKRNNPRVVDDAGRLGGFMKVSNVSDNSLGEVEFETGHELSALVTNNPKRAVAEVNFEDEGDKSALSLTATEDGKYENLGGLGSYYEGYLGVNFRPYALEGAQLTARAYREAVGTPVMNVAQGATDATQELNRYGMPRHAYTGTNYAQLRVAYDLNEKVTLVNENQIFSKQEGESNRRTDVELGFTVKLM